MRRQPSVSIAVVGNPNAGKSTLFNRLTGMRQKTGNYPGVTVEKHVGITRIGDTSLELIDLIAGSETHVDDRAHRPPQRLGIDPHRVAVDDAVALHPPDAIGS